MRKLLSLSFAIAFLFVAACGASKKKTPAAPTNSSSEPAGAKADDKSDEKSSTAPADSDDKPMAADPCEGGE